MRIRFEFNKKEIGTIDNFIKSINQIIGEEQLYSTAIELLSEQEASEDFITEIENDAITVKSKCNKDSLEEIIEINEVFFDDLVSWVSKFIRPFYNLIKQVKPLLKENPLDKWFKKKDINANFYNDLFKEGYKYIMKSTDNDKSKDLVFREKQDVIAYIFKENLSGYSVINLETQEVIINA